MLFRIQAVHLAIDKTLRLEAAFEALSAGGFSNWPAAILPMRSSWEATCFGKMIPGWWIFNRYSWLVERKLSPLLTTSLNTGCKAHWKSLNHLGAKLKTCAKAWSVIFPFDLQLVLTRVVACALDGTARAAAQKEITWDPKIKNHKWSLTLGEFIHLPHRRSIPGTPRNFWQAKDPWWEASEVSLSVRTDWGLGDFWWIPVVGPGGFLAGPVGLDLGDFWLLWIGSTGHWSRYVSFSGVRARFLAFSGQDFWHIQSKMLRSWLKIGCRFLTYLYWNFIGDITGYHQMSPPVTCQDKCDWNRMITGAQSGSDTQELHEL